MFKIMWGNLIAHTSVDEWMLTTPTEGDNDDKYCKPRGCSLSSISLWILNWGQFTVVN